jgi:hypothetical protein
MGARTGPDLVDALPRFLLRCENDVARIAYRAAVGRFLAWTDSGLGPGAVERYAEYERGRGMSEAIVRWRARVAGEFVEYARECGLLPGGVR